MELMDEPAPQEKKGNGIVDGMTSKQSSKDNSLDLVGWCGNEINNGMAPRGKRNLFLLGSGMPAAVID